MPLDNNDWNAVDFRAVAEASPVQMWTADPTGRLTYVNPMVTRYFNCSAAEVLGEAWKNVLHQADVVHAAGRWMHALTTGEDYTAEFRLLRASNRVYYWHLAQAAPVRDTEGRIVFWVGTNTNINGLKRSVEFADARHEMARRERDRITRAFHYAPAVVALYSGPDFVIQMANPAWEEFHGARGKRAIGRPARQAFPEMEEQGLFDLLEKVRSSGRAYRATEICFRYDRDGDGQQEDTFWNLLLQPLSEPGQSVNEILSHSVEVTDLVLARRELESLQKKLLP